MPLPIEPVLAALEAALRERGMAVLQAPPGAGKTTLVPLRLRDAPWLEGRRIVMLEPRRIAARAAARYMARLLGEGVGATVGYRIRHDTRITAATRVEVVTEGVLTRMLQEDPGLEGTGLVIFDEFHERSLHADEGLALTLQTRRILRPDLRLLVMSATLDGAAVATLLGDAPVITCEGRAFPVDRAYRPRRKDQRLEPAVAATVREALDHDAGDILVFLPGAAKIRRTAALLADIPRVFPLHGTLPPEEQEAAIAPSPPGTRKVVLATSIAETSLTIEGVRAVVDAGLMRVPRFSPRTGMTRLVTTRVTRASAEQRAGRAGRLGPGVCYRLWAPEEDAGLVPFNTPEILEADLAPLALDLAAAGVANAADLAWLTPPPAAALSQARELLLLLGALDAEGRITRHGRALSLLPLHPRLAHMLVEARRRGLDDVACEVAALLGERDILRAPGPGGLMDADLRLRVDVLRSGGRTALPGGIEVDRGALKRVQAEAVLLKRSLRGARGAPFAALGAGSAIGGSQDVGLLLGLAYPDRIAQRRPGRPGRFLLRNGRGASLDPGQPLAQADYIVAAALDDAGTESRIFLAAPLDAEAVDELSRGQIEEDAEVVWDEATGAVVARRRTQLGALVLREGGMARPDPDRVVAVLVGALARRGVDRLPWTDASRGLRERLAFLHRLDAAWPDVSDAALAASLGDWLGPHLNGVTRLDQLVRVDLGEALLARLSWDQRARLDTLAPERIEVPSGSRIAIDYANPEAPVLPVRLQEMFGLAETPRIAGGRVALTLHLLSPAFRPVQVTRDLAGFWRTTYFEVRKDLRGRYPKHHWPENPLEAEPVRGAKKRGR